LPSGKVLVSGGSPMTEGGAELYDPATGIWTRTAPMLVDRHLHSAVLLASGRVLVAGGYNADSPGCLATAELYDPSTETWASTGSMNVPRCAGGGGFAPTGYATLLPDGRVLITAGGKDGIPLTSTELYDPATGTWSVTGSTSRVYSYGMATLLPTGKVLIVGEENGGTGAELYDPATGSWSPAARAPRAHELGTATLLKSGKVLVATGLCQGTADLYDSATNRWAPAAPMVVPQSVQAAARVEPSGNVLVVEGDRCLDPGAPGSSAELFVE
jgi:hypothetical protein